jgi:hypothetical protein
MLRASLVPALAAAVVLLLPNGATARPTVDQTLARAQALGVGAEARSVGDQLLAGARMLPGGSAAVGHTRLGGRPDLPDGSRWPTCHGRRLSFLAQVNLGALAQAVPGATPARGLLSVFADLREDADGIPPVEEFSGPVTPGACVAVHHSGTGARPLRRRARTPPDVPTLRTTPIRLRPTLTVPDSLLTETLGGRPITSRKDSGWIELQEETALGVLGRRVPNKPIHQLLGWSRPVQEDPTFGCGASSRPRYRLLLQLDFDPPLRFAVGDGGSLYLTILPADLRAGRLDRLCAVFDEG